MNSKVFFAVFVGLLAVHASSQSPLKDDSAKDIVANVVEDILTITGSALDIVNNAIDFADDNVELIRDEIVDLIELAANEVNGLILSEVDKLADGATDAGKEVLSCIDAQQGNTENAIAKVASDIGNCAYKESDKIIDEAKSILAILNQLQSDVKSKTDSLRSCFLGDVLCLTAYVQGLSEIIEKIPAAVEKEIADLIELIENIIDDVDSCGGYVIQEVRDAAQDIFNSAVVCIKS